MIARRITDALKSAFDVLIEDLNRDQLELWNESVLRYHISKELCLAEVDVRNEWNRVDLVAKDMEETAFVELKFYSTTVRKSALGVPIAVKGRPSKKNLEEFIESSDIVVNASKNKGIVEQWGMKIDHVLIAMIYVDRTDSNNRKYSDYYGELADSLSRQRVFNSSAKAGNYVATCSLYRVT